MASTNRFADECGHCRQPVAAGTGILGGRKGGRWIVYCDQEHATADAMPQARDAEPDGPAGPPTVEVRVTGTLAQVWAVRDALQLATGLTVAEQSREYPRRDVDDGRVSTYLQVQVAPRVLATIDRDLGADQ